MVKPHPFPSYQPLTLHLACLSVIYLLSYPSSSNCNSRSTYGMKLKLTQALVTCESYLWNLLVKVLCEYNLYISRYSLVISFPTNSGLQIVTVLKYERLVHSCLETNCSNHFEFKNVGNWILFTRDKFHLHNICISWVNKKKSRGRGLYHP